MKNSIRLLAWSLLLAAAFLPISAQAAARNWLGNSTVDLNLASNWDTLPVSADSWLFGLAGTAGSTLNNDFASGFIVNGITFNAGGSAFTIGGNDITLNGTITNSSGVTQTLSMNMTLAATRSIVGSSGGSTILSGVISGAGGITKTNSFGNLSLLGANTYTGPTTMSRGTLFVTSLNSVVGGTASSSLGAPVTVANGTISLGVGAQAAALSYSGSGETTDRVINLASSSGGVTLDQAGAGLLKFTSNLTATGAGNKTLTLQGSTAGTGEFAGVIVDNSGTNKTAVSKAGTGNWTLSAINTYSGGTTVTAGKLSLSGSGTLGASSANLTVTNGILDLGGTSQTSGLVTFNGTGTTQNGTLTGTAYEGLAGTVTAVLGGTGVVLTKNGTGALTLNATNTYTGGTLLNAGTLRVGAATAPGASAALGTGALTVGDGTKITSTLNSNNALTLSNNITVGGNFTIGETGFTGPLTFSGNVSLGSQDRVITTVGNTHEFTGDITGSGGIIKEGTGTLAFSTVARSFTGNVTINNGLLSIRSNGTSIGPASKTVFINGGGLSVYGAQALAMDNLIVVGGNFTLAGGGNVITLRGAMDLGATDRTINVTGGGNNTISGNISGAGGLMITDSFTASPTTPTLKLTGNNTFGGNVTLGSSVTLSVNRTEALGNGTTFNHAQNASLFMTGNMSVNKIVNIADGGVGQDIVVAAGVTASLDGKITGGAGASWRKDGGGVLVITAANDYTASFTNIGGLVRISGNGTLGASTANFALNNASADLGGTSQTVGIFTLLNGQASSLSNGTLSAASFVNNETANGVGTVSAILAGGGGFTQTGAGTTILTAANTYSGATAINAGRFQIGNAGATGSLSTSSAITNNATLAFNRTNTVTQGTDFATAISGTGNLEQSGAGNLILAAGNSYTGNTTVNGGGTGSVTISDDSALGAAPVAATADHLVLNDGALVTTGTMVIDSNRGILLGGTQGGQINVNSGTTTYGGIIAGSKALQKAGTGVLLLTGANSYTGATQISAGTLLVNGSTNVSSAVSVEIGGTLGGSGTVNGTVAVADGGTLSPGNSPGLLTEGATTLNGGGNYNWQVVDALGSAGVGYDSINLTAGSALTLNNTSGNTFNINLWSLSSISPDVSGNANFFNPSNNYSWTLISTDQTIAGFAADKFTIHVAAFNGTGGFTNTHSGTFSVALGDSDTDLMLVYTAVPEPAAWILAAFGLTTAVVFRRRRQD